MREIVVSKRAEELNKEDRIDFVDLASIAESNGGSSKMGFYCADVVQNAIYICCESERGVWLK